MKTLPWTGALALLLAACHTTPVDTDDTAIAHGGAAPSKAEQQKQLTEQNVPQDTGDGKLVNPDEERPGPDQAAPAPAVVEFAQVRLDLKNPQGNRAVAYYLMKPDEWMIDRVVMISPTVKELRFRRVTSGNRTPDLDPLRQALDPNAPRLREAVRPPPR